MTLIASIITFSKKKKNGKKNVTFDPRHGTLTLDMEPSTLDPRQKDRLDIISLHVWQDVCFVFFLSQSTVMHSRYRIVHSLKGLDQTTSTGSTHLTAISEVKFKKYIHISRCVWLKVVASWVILHSV